MIARRIENLLALDYPAEKLQIVVSSDASSDRTEEIALQYPGVQVISNPRGGKVAAQDRAVRQTDGEIVAFSDANCTWSPDALRTLVRAFADPDVAYVCGQLRILDADGGNKEGVYWRYEMEQRAAESQLGSITGGNGSIYAVRRADYVEVDPRFGHDLSLPYLMVQHGRRAVYEPDGARLGEADAVERDRVPAQGADVRALLADRAARQDAPPARPALLRSRSSRIACSATARGSCTWSCSRPRSRCTRTAGSTPSCSRSSSGCSLPPRSGWASPATTSLVTLGDARLARQLPAARRACDVGGRGGHPL